MGGGGIKQALLTNPLFPYRVQHSTVETERKKESLRLSDLPAASSFTETNKTPVRETEGGKLLLLYTQLRYMEVQGTTVSGKTRQSRPYCGCVCCNISAKSLLFLVS